jgi:hypothetical protein
VTTPNASASPSARSTARSGRRSSRGRPRGDARRTEVDLLAVLAFAFDPQRARHSDEDYVTSDDGFAEVAAERNLGRLPVLLVRMNNDLVMGDELKKTGAGNLFTVFGEPDIEIRTGRRATSDGDWSRSSASTCTTRRPARSAAATPTTSRCG